MTDKHEEAANKKALARKYSSALRQHEEKLKEELSTAQYHFFCRQGYRADTTIYSELSRAMRNPDNVPSEYISKNLEWLFDGAIPKREKNTVLYFADKLHEYPYSVSVYRRSFRSKGAGAYAEKLMHMIRSFGSPTTIDEPLERILNRELPEEVQAYLDEFSWNGCGYNEWQVAYALDHHNSKIEEAVRRILTEENGSGMMTTNLVRGVVISHRSDFHELLGKLLLAAKLQEGLRQVICENADCGTQAAFLTLLKVIDEHNLIRFSSVKRAVGMWTGILTENIHALDRISEKCIRLILDCLENHSVRAEYLASEDAMKIYIALWSYGSEDIGEVVKKFMEIADHGSIHQLLAAGYFAANMDFPSVFHSAAKIVLKQHAEEEKVLAVWLPGFLPGGLSKVRRAIEQHQRIDYSTWFERKAELDEYYLLFKNKLSSFDEKSKTFSPCVFPWHEATIAKNNLAEIVCMLAVLSGDSEKLDDACALIKECNPDYRNSYFFILLHAPQTPIQRKAALDGLVDKETYTRQTAYDIVSRCILSKEEYRILEDYLRFKGADIRKNVMTLLMWQSDADLEESIAHLLVNAKEEVRIAGLDMLIQLKKNAKRSKIADAFTQALSERIKEENLPAKEKILLETLVPAEAETQKPEAPLFKPEDKYLPSEFDSDYIDLCVSTFTDYFPDSRLPESLGIKKSKLSLWGKIKSTVTNQASCSSALTAAADLMSLSKLIDTHKTDSFIGSMGESMLLGNIRYPHQLHDENGQLPFKDLWEEWLKTNTITKQRLVRALVLHRAYTQQTKFSTVCTDSIKTVFGPGFESGKELPHAEAMEMILFCFSRDLPEKDLIHLASALAFWFIRTLPDDMVLIHAPGNESLPVQYEMAHLLAHNQFLMIYEWLLCKNDANLKNTFPLAVASAERCSSAFEKIHWEESDSTTGPYYYFPTINTNTLAPPYAGRYRSNKKIVGINAYLLATYQSIITEAQLFEYLLHPSNLRDSLELVSAIAAYHYDRDKQISSHNSNTDTRIARLLRELLGKPEEPNEEDLRLIRFVAHIYEIMIPAVLASELKRGDSPATYSRGISGITRLYGAKYFAEILSALGNDSPDRSIYGGYSSATDRKSSLSHLLAVCIPAQSDSPDTLRTALAGKSVSAKRLIEAAFFSPEWIPIIGKVLEIDAFESVCYYFIAHMNERFDNKRKAMIAKFTPLTEDELNLGAFDLTWFYSAHSSIGEKEFLMIYEAAKYTADGAKHTRARKYADAALGKFDVSETEKAVSAKRNKDLLMAYALIPLKGEDDICRRYLYIQNFRKESKQFGSQRATSEGKAAEMALKNLAINAGYSDTMRLTLRMEIKVIDDSRAILEEQVIDGVSFHIALDEEGKASLICAKDGKQLKSIPAKLKKNETVLVLTNTVKTLTAQYRRTRVMLERAMEDCTVFTFGEFSTLSTHPVVYPMLKNLVLISGDAIGFITKEGLVDASGTVHPLDLGAEIKIAHPFDLYHAGCWKNYQRYLFENKITQPFRQVFRELYIKTAEEMTMFYSLRYAGNQIQPAKTVSTLKGRRWIADIEDGLQKVYYRENIVAQIYALADWFSPADIEAPTLEWVCFANRKNGEQIKISDVPDIVFSEVMRDVDLAVSVAHAGGVDPETSHSTMEMRAAILSFVLPMFRIENVRITEHHAIVEGKLAEYSIHLGSGVVHQLGGTMIPVLPVHSQHRGKIFLPFADEDPKTAEIISKILLFAEDSKIKDPLILSCIRK